MHKYSTQYIDAEDIESVVSALESENLTQGPYVKKLEDEICNYASAPFTFSVNSATKYVRHR